MQGFMNTLFIIGGSAAIAVAVGNALKWDLTTCVILQIGLMCYGFGQMDTYHD